MMSRHEEEPSTPKDIEPKSNPGLTFVEWEAAPFNNQGMRLIEEQVISFRDSTPGEKTIFIGRGTSDTREADIIRRLIKILGANFVMYHVLTQELERIPSPREIESRRKEIDEAGIPLAARRGLLPLEWGSTYFLLSLLERLGGIKEFNIEVESNSRGVARRVSQLVNEIIDLHTKVTEAFRSGNFEEGEELLKRVYKSRAEMVKIRNAGTAEILKEKMKKLRKKKEGGVFMAFGAEHEGIPSMLKRKLPGTPITFRTTVPSEEIIDPEDGDGALRLYAHEVIAANLLLSLSEDNFVKSSNNYIKIHSAIRRIVLEMEPEEIRSILSGKEDPLEILRDHDGNHPIVLLSNVLQEQDGD